VADRTPPLGVEELHALVASGEIDTVVLAFPDMQGRLQGKRFAARFFLDEVLHHGTEGCNYLLAVDTEMNTVDGYAMSSWDRGYGDFAMRPDLSTLRRVPWNAGTALLVGFVLYELRAKHPMLPMRLFRIRSFSAINAASLLMLLGMFGSIFLLSQYLQTVGGYSPMQAGVRMLPWTAMPMIAGPLAGALSDRIGGAPVVTAGMALNAVGLGLWAITVEPHVAYTHLLPALIVCGIGLGMFFAPSANLVMSTVRPEELATMREFISELMPDLNPDPIRMSAYMEGYTDSGDPLVGRLPGEDDIIVMAGFSGSGFKLSPAMGEIAADLALDGTTDHPVDFLAPAAAGAV